MPEERPLLIGVGNRHRRDDALGLAVVERLVPRLGGRVRVVLFEGESTGLLDLWDRVPRVVLVDAVPSRGQPGRVHRIEGDLTLRLPTTSNSSTHGLGVGEAWHLGATLGQLPQHLVVFAVEGEDFTPGVGLSPAVVRSVEAAADAVRDELGAPPREDPSPAGRSDSHA